MDATIGILGQTILVLISIALVVAIVFFILRTTLAIRRLIGELKAPILPPTDSYIPRPFDGRRV
jgi:small neutral amino acid transporter SnatA (MarC family)